MGLGYLHRLFYLDLDSYYLEVQSDLDLVSVDWELIFESQVHIARSNLLSNIAKLGLARKNQGSLLDPVDK